MKKLRKRGRIIILCFVIAVILGGACLYAVYNGYILLNNPSKNKYPIRGVDVSHYQGEIDWEVLSSERIQFAYIKATEGSSHVDDRFLYNLEQAKMTELLVGAYHFFSFDSPGEEQAKNFIKNVEVDESMLPPVVDVEYYGNKKKNPPNADKLRKELRIYLDSIQEYYNLTPIIYATEEMWNAYLKGYFDSYPLWIRNVITKPKIEREWAFWQYTNRGRLKGYQGEEAYIDLNVFYGDKEQWKEFH